MEENNQEIKVEKDSNTSLYVIIVLVVLLIGCVGYLIYIKKFEKNNDIPNDNTETKVDDNGGNIEVETKTLENSIDSIINNYPKTSDTNISGKVPVSNGDEGLDEGKYTFNYNNYKIVYNYIDGAYDMSSITIYDSDNKKIYYNEEIKTTFMDEEDNYHELIPIISNGKLNFLSHNLNKCFLDDDGYSYPYFEYRQINLNDVEIKEETLVSIEYFTEGAGNGCKS